MDDYRDLVAAGLTLVCAGIMLVAGQLYIEQRAANQLTREVESPQAPRTSPAFISRAPSPHEDSPEPRQGLKKNGQG
jgi:hypothetical protein